MKIILEERAYQEEDILFYIRNKKDNRKLGFCCLFFYEDYVEITNLYIRKGFRGKGIATKTLKKVKSFWKKKYKKLPLRLVPFPCIKDDNCLEMKPLKKMYKKAGFFKINKKDEYNKHFFELKENF